MPVWFIGNNKSSTIDDASDLMAECLFQGFWQNKTRPSDNIHFEYIRVSMNFAGAVIILVASDHPILRILWRATFTSNYKRVDYSMWSHLKLNMRGEKQSLPS